MPGGRLHGDFNILEVSHFGPCSMFAKLRPGPMECWFRRCGSGVNRQDRVPDLDFGSVGGGLINHPIVEGIVMMYCIILNGYIPLFMMVVHLHTLDLRFRI
jgi:hypothetical protein